MQITDNHGRTFEAKPGQFLVYEYYKGFVNNVFVFDDRHNADYMKESLERGESYMMNSPKHFSIKEVK